MADIQLNSSDTERYQQAIISRQYQKINIPATMLQTVCQSACSDDLKLLNSYIQAIHEPDKHLTLITQFLCQNFFLNSFMVRTNFSLSYFLRLCIVLKAPVSHVFSRFLRTILLEKKLNVP